MRLIAAAACLSLFFGAGPARAASAPPISLPKMGKWRMHYGDDTCQLATLFGSEKDNVILELRREQPGDMIDLHLYGKRLRSKDIKVPVELTFGSNGTPHLHDGTAMTNGSQKLPMIRLAGLRIDGSADQKHPAADLPPVTPAREAEITTIAFKVRAGKTYQLETGSMATPLAAMRTCTDDLIKGWGYDPAARSALTRTPEPATKPESWITGEDFPFKALWAGNNGLVRFRIDVDPAGNPDGCKVLYRTNPDEFADLSCKLLLKRAHFKPALDAQAKPVRWYYINSIRWLSPL